MNKKHHIIPQETDRIIGDNILRRRELIGFSRDELAKTLKLPSRYIEKYEKGEMPVPQAHLIEIARQFYCSVETLCGYDPTRGMVVPSPLLSDDKQLEEILTHFMHIQDLELRKFVYRTLLGVSMLDSKARKTKTH